MWHSIREISREPAAFKNCHELRDLGVALALTGGVVLSSRAVAKQSDDITVVAPHVVHRQVGQTPSGIPIEEITLTRRVGCRDVDLATPAGAALLEKRIKETAKQACAQLDSLYPDSIYPTAPDSPDCVKSAIDGAMAQARTVIAAARA